MLSQSPSKRIACTEFDNIHLALKFQGIHKNRVQTIPWMLLCVAYYKSIVLIHVRAVQSAFAKSLVKLLLLGG